MKDNPGRMAAGRGKSAFLRTPEPLHPESMRTLRQLYKLHGSHALAHALNIIIDDEIMALLPKEVTKRG